MHCLEVSGAVRPIYSYIGFRGLRDYWQNRTPKLCAAITVVTFSEYGDSVWYRKIHWLLKRTTTTT